MRTWISNVKVRAVADALQNGVRLAQAESLSRSRQVVFALTNNSAPQTIPIAAVTNGSYWAIYTIPSMAAGSETNVFVDSGVLGSTTANVPVTGQQAAICFSSVGRLVANGLPDVTNVTGGPTCSLPSGNPPVLSYDVGVGMTGVDHPLRIQVSLGGQVHMCDPSKTLSSTNPDGC
jgi:type IV fimbrial biogenesis protein FimT